MIPTSQPNAKGFFLALLVLLAVHTLVSLAAYRVFTKTEEFPGSPSPNEITTPEQQQHGERSFRTVTMTGRTTTPLPVYFYIVFGYAGLGTALAIGVFTWLRHQL